VIAGLMVDGLSVTSTPVGELVRVHIGQIIVVMGWAFSGLAIGCLVRSQTAAVLVLIALPFVVEPMVKAALETLPGWAGSVTQFLPFAASTSMVTVGSAPARGCSMMPNGHPVLGGVVFLAAVTAALLAANAVFAKRDLAGR